ncbi:hypothetical protein V8G54_035066 [Vigna mungo]|uniref:Uncharacterized protein n=1 Tax=Vigna mungo TaxID=3915 RepID=A0AAQ3MEH8_VIGMU
MFTVFFTWLEVEEEQIDAYLDEHIDDLLGEENLDLEMSPPHNSGFEAVFEGNHKVLNDSTSNVVKVANKTSQANTKSNDGCEVALKCLTHWVARLCSSGRSTKM